MRMKSILVKYFLLLIFMPLLGCSAKAGYFFSSLANPIAPSTITLQDSAKSLYYTFAIGEEDKIDTFLFFFPGSGCSSLKYYIRDYLKGLKGNIRVFALQKRRVSHTTTGVFGCPGNFDEYNHFGQWISDYDFFVKYILAASPKKPKRILCFGVSEGAVPAAAVAAKNPGVTHVAIIGQGGMKMRDDLKLLVKKQDIKPDADLEEAFGEIFREPNNISKRFLTQTYKYWASVLDVDPLDYLLSLGIPVIVGQGEKDEKVPVESAYYLKDRFDKAGKQNLKLVIYPDADHTLRDLSGKSFRPDFLSMVSIWIKNETPQ